MQNAQRFHLTEGMLHSSKRWWLWKELVVMCGKWNVRQATLQQVFKVTTFCMDTCFQSFLPLINCIVHRALLKFSPCRNVTLLQLVRIADWWYLIHVKKWKQMKNLCILRDSAVTFFRCGAVTTQTDTRTHFAHHAFNYTGPFVWKSLDSYIVESGSFAILKSRLFRQTFAPSAHD